MVSPLSLVQKRKCDPLKWNVAAGRADGKTEYAKSLNAYPELLPRKVYESRKHLLENDDPVTAENIKTILQGKEINRLKYMLMEIFKSRKPSASSYCIIYSVPWISFL